MTATAPTTAALHEPWTLLLEPGRPLDTPFLLDPPRLSWTGPDGERTADGFCDHPAGAAFRARILPLVPGEYRWSCAWMGETVQGSFTASGEGNDGMWRAVDRHFENARGPVWPNGTTAYLMAGLSEEAETRALDRLATHRVNRIRVSLTPSRQVDGGRWYEPQVGHRDEFTYFYGPWLQARPESATDPGWDVERFDVAYWRRFERLLTRARERGIAVQVVFFTDAQEGPNYPFDREHDDPAEARFYEYAAARLAAHANVEWCLTNEWALFRPDEWVNVTGRFLAAKDPYGHLMTVHGHGHFPFADEPWCSHALYQLWDEHGGHDAMLERVRATPKPVLNEEFGYEDHYPGPWGDGRVAPARALETRLRCAWEIAMAGAYSTDGESAASGEGGWINGLRTDSDDLLKGRRAIREFFEAIPEWWRFAPTGDRTLRHPDGRVVAIGTDGMSGTLIPA